MASRRLPPGDNQGKLSFRGVPPKRVLCASRWDDEESAVSFVLRKKQIPRPGLLSRAKGAAFARSGPRDDSTMAALRASFRLCPFRLRVRAGGAGAGDDSLSRLPRASLPTP